MVFCRKLSRDAAGSGASTSTSTENSTHPDSCFGTYQKIRNNRYSRLRIKSRKRKSDDTVLCPVCNERTSEEINLHVEKCLRKSENKSNGDLTDDDDSIDIEGEEYEWAGQTRIRASSLLEGGYASLGIGTSRSSATPDEDEDLNVDGDDDVYGIPQYTERDIIPVENETKKEDMNSLYLRNLVIGNNTSGSDNAGEPSSSIACISQTNHNNLPTTSSDINNYSNHNDEKESNAASTATALRTESASESIIESLRQRIKELEFQIKNKSKCLICLDEYKVPVVSVCCWHVHCEECWLRTLGARKLCPQCNMITSPTELRRIYM